MTTRPSSDSVARRDFVKLTSAGMVAAATSLSATPSFGKGANDKLIVGLIGCGGRGTHDAGLFKNTSNVELKYVCDVDDARRAAAAEKLGVNSTGAVSDMRRILEDKEVDAVIVGTPDHWHSLAAILACDAGKHVYVEKPISHNIR